MQERETVQEKQSKLERIYDPNLKAEVAISAIQDMAAEMEAQAFGSEAEAQAANDAYRQELNKLLAEVSGFKNILMKVSGSGVRAPDISITPDTSSDKPMSYAVSLESPQFESLDPFESEVVTFNMMTTQVYQEDGDEAHRIETVMVTSSVQPRQVAMTASNLQAPIASVFVFPTYLVDMAGDTVIEIPELEEKRSKIGLMQEIARSGLTDEIFRRSLSKFRNAFRSTPETEYVDLEDMDTLYELGRISNEQARRGRRNSDLMSRAVLDAIGKGRYIVVGGVPKGREDEPIDTIVTGQVIEVLMPSADEDELSPTFVIESANAEGNEEIYYYPLERISSLRF